ncbi:hypothetical protein J3458_022594 [Metarhizium acridum]|uniref:uncharacterized protein n=1 Tax=Metarhizium acridum TaxID=92637 RepID=UPI001C6C2ACF|nr:hypothetical protein J3458_022594 [Metarhizium acridum]
MIVTDLWIACVVFADFVYIAMLVLGTPALVLALLADRASGIVGAFSEAFDTLDLVSVVNISWDHHCLPYTFLKFLQSRPLTSLAVVSFSQYSSQTFSRRVNQVLRRYIVMYHTSMVAGNSVMSQAARSDLQISPSKGDLCCGGRDSRLKSWARIP